MWGNVHLVACAHVHVALLVFCLTCSVSTLMNFFASFHGKYPKLIKPILIVWQYCEASIMPTELLFQHPVTHLNAQ